MKILLTTLHAKYSHASLALPALAANCRLIQGVDVVIREWTVNEPAEQLLRLAMAEQADLVAFSCYIWNIEKSLRIASDIKKVSPGTLIALGGPEASFGVFELMRANPAVDFVIKGEGEKTFRQLVEILASQEIRSTGGQPPPALIPAHEGAFAETGNLFSRDGDDIVAGPPSKVYLQLDSLPSPFEAGLVDLKKPQVYYETSRGCPFSCAFCLSSVEGKVRSYSMDRIRNDLQFLMGRHVPSIKLVDRTFNYDAKRADQIWGFILEHNQGSHFHFEIAADLLTKDNILLLQRVPDQTFRFEIGVQSTSEGTLALVGRNSDLASSFHNIRRLRSETRVELHLDLIGGLPGEDYHGFLDSLQQVAGLNPHEIQIEPLKVLKGSPMRQIAQQEDYRFSAFPPYTILSTPWLSFAEICRIETIARLLDLFHNRGGFANSLSFMLQKMNFADLFDLMAGQIGAENLSGFSTRRVYELFARLSIGLVSHEETRLLRDVLFYDYCLNELPQMGKLPGFIVGRHQECSWPGRRDLPPGVELAADSRVKLFRFTFLRDYRIESWPDNPAGITFVYASKAGHGQSVTAL